MLRPGVCWDWRTSWYAVLNWQQMWSGVESGSLYMTLSDQHSWKGICWDWVWIATGRSVFDTVPPLGVINPEIWEAKRDAKYKKFWQLIIWKRYLHKGYQRGSCDNKVLSENNVFLMNRRKYKNKQIVYAGRAKIIIIMNLNSGFKLTMQNKIHDNF